MLENGDPFTGVSRPPGERIEMGWPCYVDIGYGAGYGGRAGRALSACEWGKSCHDRQCGDGYTELQHHTVLQGLSNEDETEVDSVGKCRCQ